LFGEVAAARALDYTSRLNMLRRGRLELLLPGDIPRNHAGFAPLEAAGTATSIGVSYALQRTEHHKLERWLSVGHISVAGVGDAHNYALRTASAALKVLVGSLDSAGSAFSHFLLRSR
jgi:hypothetical protein